MGVAVALSRDVVLGRDEGTGTLAQEVGCLRVYSERQSMEKEQQSSIERSGAMGLLSGIQVGHLGSWLWWFDTGTGYVQYTRVVVVVNRLFAKLYYLPG